MLVRKFENLFEMNLANSKSKEKSSSDYPYAFQGLD